MPSKKSVNVSFVTSRIKKMRKKVDDFKFLPLNIVEFLDKRPFWCQPLVGTWCQTFFNYVQCQAVQCHAV